MHADGAYSIQQALLGGGWGYAPTEICRKYSCPEIESGGFWQLADYPTHVFKITAFFNLVIENWNKYHGFKVIMTSY